MTFSLFRQSEPITVSSIIILTHLDNEEIVMKFSLNIFAFAILKSSRVIICFPVLEFKVKTEQLSEAVCDTLTIFHVI